MAHRSPDDSVKCDNNDACDNEWAFSHGIPSTSDTDIQTADIGLYMHVYMYIPVGLCCNGIRIRIILYMCVCMYV